MKPVNSLQWIESKNIEKLTSQIKFHPRGRGRGESERKYKPFIGKSALFREIRDIPSRNPSPPGRKS
jgi:hypothetical protein